MRVERYECDVCKRASNGDTASWWFVATKTFEESPPYVVAAPLKDVANTDPGAHACGMECALKLVAQAMRELPR